MKVLDLINYLKEFPEDAEVGFEVPSGDHWRTRLVYQPQQLSVEQVEYSEYHRALKLADPNEDSADSMVVLSY